MTFRLLFDWVDAEPSPDALARHTMAELFMEAGGAAITAVADKGGGARSDRIVVPLFGVAEWLVYNWWHIFHEVEDTRTQKPGFASRHDMAFSSDGFILPRLTLIPGPGENIALRWRRSRPRYARIQFVGEGEENVTREQLEERFRHLIEAVLERLRERGADAETLEKEWASIEALDPHERDFCRAAALLGVDPFDMPDPLADRLIEFCEYTDRRIRDDAVAAASPSSLARVQAWLAKHLESLAAARSGAWPEVRAMLRPNCGGNRWENGYDLARAARRQLGAGGGRFDFAAAGPLAHRPVKARVPSPRIEGLVAADAPACVATSRSETEMRFLAARALGDYLGRSAPGAGILSTLATDRQARSRAFAAEFLAPRESLRARLEDVEAVDPNAVDELGVEFGVSSAVVRRQIENHGLAEVARR